MHDMHTKHGMIRKPFLAGVSIIFIINYNKHRSAVRVNTTINDIHKHTEQIKSNAEMVKQTKYTTS